MDTRQIGATAGYGFAHFGIEGGFDDYLWCFRRLRELGFRNFNMEILEQEHTQLFSPDRVRMFRETGGETGIAIPIFTAYYLENDLASISAERREKALRGFEFSLEVAQALGSTIINIASEFPPELVESYRPEYVHSPAARFRIPPEISWASIWNAQVEVMRACSDMAAARGMSFSLEPRANCIVSTADSFLRLADNVGRTNFGCSLDLMHSHFQREDIPTAIKKLGPLLMEVQVCDSDGQTLTHLPVGRGNIEFDRVLSALDEIGYSGPLQLEIYGVDNIDEAYRSSRLALENMISLAAHGD